MSDRALKGWHSGERAVQNIINLPERVSITAVVNKLPEQHRIFHTSRLYFLPVTTLDPQGRPWASILTSRDGTPGFIESPSEKSLIIRARLWDGDPAMLTLGNAKYKSSDAGALFSAVGLETTTRRRNKFAGYVSNASFVRNDLSLQVVVTQALGLCPKYINVRTVSPHPDTQPEVLHRSFNLREDERLPEEVISFVHSADTAYLGTYYKAPPQDESTYPSHVGTNHRGGRPGFVRVRPSDGRTLVLPNYAGNRLMNSLGNIHVTPLAGIVFPSFADGSVLYVTGKAETLFGPPAQQLMPLVNVVTTIYVSGFSLVRDALPIRQSPALGTERSPYSPPVRYLAEEKPPEVSYDDIHLTLIRARIHDDTLVTFTFRSSKPVEIKPSQNAVLDLSQFLRVRSHELLKWTEEARTENDDCVRTWTVSIPPSSSSPDTFSITMRKINGGLVTPIIYQIVRDAAGKGSEIEVDVAPLDISARLRGIGGDLPVPEPIAACDGGRRLLWLAGGIGLTPFVGLIRHVSQLVRRTFGLWDIVLVITTREPDVMLRLVADALGALSDVKTSQDISFTIHLFSWEIPKGRDVLPPFVDLQTHQGRIECGGSFFKALDAKAREPHICGPLPFVTTCMKAMQEAGVDPERVRRERFTY